MSVVEVRRARTDELAAAGAVTQAAWDEFARPEDPLWLGYYERLGDAAARAARAVVLVALADGDVVGTATVELDETLEEGGALGPDEAGLRMLAVAPAWRGRGIGRLLVEASLAAARAARKRRATLHTLDLMTAATHLYRSLGFERDPASDVVLAPELVLRAYRLEL